ncbi:MAG: uridine kinase [Candidatus Marsarchaeota archaeon]|jgi:molybdenum storage protein|nr:uridine kinase [Candidatus Marsarchaeota archaeon]
MPGQQRSQVRLLPDAWVVKIGGQSVIDRGRKALYPVLDELVANIKAGRKLIIGTGAGTRARHVYSLAVDLGLPTGVLSTLGAGVASQNARMLEWLLSSHGIPLLSPASLSSELTFQLAERGAVVFPGMPPYTFWERYPDLGLIPSNRTDTGCFLLAETLGVRGMVYVKDEDGLYTDDPKKNTKADFIPKISVNELLSMKLPDFVVEPQVLKFMTMAVHVRRIQIVNGLKKGNLTKALNGEDVGTVIYA